jgi:hypothetical protein
MTPRYGIAVAALALTVTAGCGSSGEKSTTSSSAVPGFQIVGSWSGELHQKGLQPFNVSANIRDLRDPKSNTVRYTGINCGGNWTYLGLSGEAYRFREVIDRGAGGSCKGVGQVTLTPVGPNTLGYQFRGGGVESRGDLTREP